MRKDRTVIAASRVISAPPERVFEFLSDLHNHWRLEAHFVEVEHLDPEGDGGRVRLRGLFGMGRTVHTRVEEAVPSSRLRGRADIGGGTVGRVAWDIEAADGGSRVSLSAVVERAGPLDRAILALGGSRYLRRIFTRTLENLERELAD
jgi:uncharacterized protein YndB with AHSA1/START domain